MALSRSDLRNFEGGVRQIKEEIMPMNLSIGHIEVARPILRLALWITMASG
jgi:hypothetical protein